MRILTLVIAFLAMSTSFAQKMSINASVDTNLLLIGEQVRLNLSINVPADKEVVWPIIKDSIGPLELVKKDSLITLNKAGWKSLSQNFILTSWDSGYVKIPAFEVKIGTSTGYFNELVVRYNLVPVEQNKLMDIKEPVQTPFPILKAILWSLGVLLLLALIGFLVWKYILKKEKALPPPPPPVPAHIIAFGALQELENSKVWEDLEKIKEYYTALTDITRKYIEGRFGLSTFEKTADELVKECKSLGLSTTDYSSLSNMLQLSVLIKFAKGTATVEQNRAYLAEMRMLVENTKMEKPDVE